MICDTFVNNHSVQVPLQSQLNVRVWQIVQTLLTAHDGSLFLPSVHRLLEAEPETGPVFFHNVNKNWRKRGSTSSAESQDEEAAVETGQPLWTPDQAAVVAYSDKRFEFSPKDAKLKPIGPYEELSFSWLPRKWQSRRYGSTMPRVLF